MNTITIELCSEDRARLDAIIEGLKGCRPNCSSCVQTALGMMSDVHNAPAEHPADAPATHLEPPAPAPDPEPDSVHAMKPTPAPVSLGEFQKAIVTRCAESAETKEKVQALIHQYAASVSAVPEDKRAAVLAALATI